MATLAGCVCALRHCASYHPKASPYPRWEIIGARHEREIGAMVWAAVHPALLPWHNPHNSAGPNLLAVRQVWCSDETRIGDF